LIFGIATFARRAAAREEVAAGAVVAFKKRREGKARVARQPLFVDLREKNARRESSALGADGDAQRESINDAMTETTTTTNAHVKT
jgi:hypothetical protein